MSNLPLQSSDADLELGNVGGGGGGGGAAEAAAAGGDRIVENDGSKRSDDGGRESSVSECSVEVESGAHESKVQLAKDCRICHLSMDATNQDSEIPIELGCCCKDDLAAAHKQCAEAWFKIKGNKTCEICGSIAQNVAGMNEAELMEHWNETNDANATAAPAAAHAPVSPSRRFWQGHRLLNFLLACMVFAFVISWLFHFNVPS